MAATVTPSEIYMSLLAGRAVTGLAQLATAPLTLNSEIRHDLQEGIKFCEFIRQRPDDGIKGSSIEQFEPILKRLTAELTEIRGATLVSPDEAESTKKYLLDLVSATRTPTIPDLVEALNFFFKASSGHTLKLRDSEGLFSI